MGGFYSWCSPSLSALCQQVCRKTACRYIYIIISCLMFLSFIYLLTFESVLCSALNVQFSIATLLTLQITAIHLCTTRFHFATLYDTNHRIAVYSAYHFQPSNGGGREKRWFVEPQVGATFMHAVSCASTVLKWSKSSACVECILKETYEAHIEILILFPSSETLTITKKLC